jgi:TetR/AcrR family transcriptional regulator
VECYLPLQVYEKEQILDACLKVFARHGYEKTSTAMLAEEAGISKALIFHHFKNKKTLYFYVLDQCFEMVRTALDVDHLPESGDFFEMKEKYSLMKLNFLLENRDVYKLLIEAFKQPPSELKTDIYKKYGDLMMERNQIWERLFKNVPLKEGVDRGQAFELIMLTMEHFEKKFLAEVKDINDFDEAYHKRLLKERTRYLNMVRFGIEG